MSNFEIIMPKMGESVEEATITKWFVKVGDKVQEDDVLLEIATDKVDSEIPSPVAGVVTEIRFEVDAVVAVGKVVAIIATGEGEVVIPAKTEAPKAEVKEEKAVQSQATVVAPISSDDRFYSPLVKSIAQTEGITAAELSQIKGTGHEGRVTRDDIMNFVQQKGGGSAPKVEVSAPVAAPKVETAEVAKPKASISIGADDQIIEMDRMRKLIADHMVKSKQTSPHVTAVVEADVTALVQWREKHKDSFQKTYGQKLTYMPVFTEAVAKALRDFPGLNASVDGDRIILRKHVNIGIAVSLPSGNLIVPVVKDADQKNLAGLSTQINTFADLARSNKLAPDDIQGGTFTITNFGSFRNIIGTPIINQPQVAILATGSIEKKPAVLETPQGDVIAIRHKMFLSLSYDHRVVDGSLGGNFLRKLLII